MTVQEYVATFLAKQHPELLEQVARAQDAVDPESKPGQYPEHLPQHEVSVAFCPLHNCVMAVIDACF
jgi:hypothetical protein